MLPRIGVLPLYNHEKRIFWINPLYFRGVEQAGGHASMLSLTEHETDWEEACRMYDGFVFTGGQDVDPALFGQEKIPECGYQAPLRDNQEIWMLRRLRELDKPVLGICRGLQIMNVAFGGTLIQDIPAQCPSAVTHLQQMPYELPHHQVTILRDSLLYSLVRKEHLSVNSMHHQAASQVASDFRITAWAEDGVVEAIELPDRRFFLGVQWHPEHMWKDYPSARSIWRGLVDACKQ